MGILTAGLMLLAAGNILATVAVARTTVFTSSQRAIQIALIWLVPVIGFIVCLAFSATQISESKASGPFAPLNSPADGSTPAPLDHPVIGDDYASQGGDASSSGD